MSFICLKVHPRDVFFHSSYIYFAEDTRATHVNLPIYVTSVPMGHLDTFSEKLKASLERIVEDGIDMQRMARVINRDERQVGNKICLWIMGSPLMLYSFAANWNPRKVIPSLAQLLVISCMAPKMVQNFLVRWMR